jgi:hypothetical protein
MPSRRAYLPSLPLAWPSAVLRQTVEEVFRDDDRWSKWVVPIVGLVLGLLMAAAELGAARVAGGGGLLGFAIVAATRWRSSPASVAERDGQPPFGPPSRRALGLDQPASPCLGGADHRAVLLGAFLVESAVATPCRTPQWRRSSVSLTLAA